MKTSADFETALRPLTTMQYVIWGAMTAGKAMYLVVISLITSLNEPIVLPIPDLARYVLILVGAGLALLSIMLWRNWTSPDQLRQAWSSVPPQELDPDAPESEYQPDRNLPPSFKALSEVEKRLFIVVRRLQVRLIICLALNDVLAAIGLITGILGKGIVGAAPLIAAAMLANLFEIGRASCRERV